MIDKENILELFNLSIGFYKGFGKKNIILSDINLSASRGELIAIVGRNGIGKSTLLKTILHLQPYLSGEIKLMNKDIKNYNRDALSKIISFVSTDILRISNLTVYELITYGRMPYTNWFGKLKNEDFMIIHDIINDLELSDISYKHLDEISDGERQRAIIGRCLVQDTPLILMDEPTAFLDITHKLDILSLLKKISVSKNKAIIFSSHDIGTLNRIADKIWLLDDNRVAEGAPEDFILNKTYDQILGKNGFKFDINKSDFIFSVQCEGKLSLIGDNDLAFQVTLKMLERNGYIQDNNATSKIEISTKGEKFIWSYYKKNHKFTFYTLYDLAKFLKS